MTAIGRVAIKVFDACNDEPALGIVTLFAIVVLAWSAFEMAR